MDVIQDILDIKDGFIHNLPIVVKLRGKEQDFFAVVLNPTDDYILISPILDSEGNQLDVKEGGKIEVATKIRGVLWSGFCDVVEVLRSDFEGIWLTYPKVLNKVQRRNFLRVEMSFPITVNIFEEGAALKSYKGFCHDLSGSGIGINLYNSLFLYENQVATIAFVYKSLSINAKITPVYNMKQGQFVRIGCRFEDIDTEFSDKIHKFVVQEQILMKKGGRI